MKSIKKPFKGSLSLILALAFVCLALTGCNKKGALNEGECKCSISLVDIPKELSMMEQNIQENFAINVTLKNLSNEKQYDIVLTADNEFKKEISLHPGVYQVYSVYASQSGNTGIRMASKEDSVTLTPEGLGAVHVYVENKEEFTSHWMSVQPMPEILLADKFDATVQINRKIINLRTDSAALISELNLNYTEPVAPYGKIELTDTNMGITVTLQNTTNTTTDYRSCQVAALYVSKNNVVFPQGVTLGMAPEAVCHSEKGLYGQPDSFTGSLLYGMDFDDTIAIYNDPVSGDKLTINLGVGDTAIRSLRYELALFEER